jgi:Domain of unknown function (DUF4288)
MSKHESGQGWYSAQLLFRCDVGGRVSQRPLWEESIRLILARSLKDAERRAEALGRATQVRYRNSRGETVRWMFVRTQRVEDLVQKKLEHGSEVSYRLIHRKRGYTGE